MATVQTTISAYQCHISKALLHSFQDHLLKYSGMHDHVPHFIHGVIECKVKQLS